MYSLHDPVHGLKAGAHHGGVADGPDEPGEPEPALVERVAEWIARTYPDADPDPIGAETCMYTTTPDEDFILERRGKVVIGSAVQRARLQVRAGDRQPARGMAADIL